MKSKLVLESGEVFFGESFGANHEQKAKWFLIPE